MEGKEIFEEVGGGEFTTIPCLNDNNDWVDLISNWVDNWKDNGKCF
jgi:ferrochelatase